MCKCMMDISLFVSAGRQQGLELVRVRIYDLPALQHAIPITFKNNRNEVEQKPEMVEKVNTVNEARHGSKQNITRNVEIFKVPPPPPALAMPSPKCLKSPLTHVDSTALPQKSVSLIKTESKSTEKNLFEELKVRLSTIKLE